MEVHGHVHVLEVPFPGCVAELPVIPVHHGDAVSLALGEVVREIVANPANRLYLEPFHKGVLV